MNQILVTEKLYVTPELKRKKKLYKFNFILSIVVIVILGSFYLHSEYARNKEQEISEDLLAEVIEDQEEITAAEREIAKQDEGVWKIMINSAQQQQSRQLQQQAQQQPQQKLSLQQMAEQNNTAQNKTTTTQRETKKKRVKYIKASNGKRYPSIGRIRIPSIGVDLAILDESADNIVEWLKISPCKFWGVDPNEIGNFSIAGHNYRNKRFFSKVPTLKNGDKIKITDIEGKTFTYSVYDKYEVEPDNTDCINPRPGKENKRIVTLITCTNDSKKRVIIHAEQI